MQLENNKDIQRFIDQILAHLEFKEAHNEIRQEYMSHIEDTVKAGISYGLSQEEAIREALARMGKAESIGTDLNKIHRPTIDWVLVITGIGLCLLSIFALSSLSFSALQGLWVFTGLCLCGGLIFLKPSYLAKAVPMAYPLAIVLIAASYFFGTISEGQPYLSFSGLNIKVVDLSLILFFVSVVGMIYKLQRKAKYFGPIIIGMAILPMIYFVSIQIFAIAALYFITILAVFISAKLNSKFLTAFTTLGVFLLSTNAHNVFVSQERLFQTQQTEAHTDFILSHLMTSNHYVGLFAMILLGMLMVRLISLAQEQKNSFSRTLVSGAATLLISATLWGILSNIGYAPMPSAGLNIPFLSYGGTLMVANLALLGMVLGANRRKTLSLN